MVKLGPVREEVCAILKTAAAVCEKACMSQAWSVAMRAVAVVRQVNVYIHDDVDWFDDLAKEADGWIRNVARFCADVLRWAHEEERRREMLAIQVLSGNVCVNVDQETKAPTRMGWRAIARPLEDFLGYDVKANDGIQLRHVRLDFDSERKVFVFTWTERKKLLDF